MYIPGNQQNEEQEDQDGEACTDVDFIQFFLDNDLIRKKKDGGLYNISFKFDTQTRAGEYGEAS